MSNVTIKLYNILKNDLKLPDAKAEEFVQAINEVAEIDKGFIATKQDIKELELKIEQTKSELLKWFIGLFIALALMIIGLYIKK